MFTHQMLSQRSVRGILADFKLHHDELHIFRIDLDGCQFALPAIPDVYAVCQLC